eukprot:2725589-Pyramimonas_sp.AAC.1
MGRVSRGVKRGAPRRVSAPTGDARRAGGRRGMPHHCINGIARPGGYIEDGPALEAGGPASVPGWPEPLTSAYRFNSSGERL